MRSSAILWLVFVLNPSDSFFIRPIVDEVTAPLHKHLLEVVTRPNGQPAWPLQSAKSLLGLSADHLKMMPVFVGSKDELQRLVAQYPHLKDNIAEKDAFLQTQSTTNTRPRFVSLADFGMPLFAGGESKSAGPAEGQFSFDFKSLPFNFHASVQKEDSFKPSGGYQKPMVTAGYARPEVGPLTPPAVSTTTLSPEDIPSTVETPQFIETPNFEINESSSSSNSSSESSESSESSSSSESSESSASVNAEASQAGSASASSSMMSSSSSSASSESSSAASSASSSSSSATSVAAEGTEVSSSSSSASSDSHAEESSSSASSSESSSSSVVVQEVSTGGNEVSSSNSVLDKVEVNSHADSAADQKTNTDYFVAPVPVVRPSAVIPSTSQIASVDQQTVAAEEQNLIQQSSSSQSEESSSSSQSEESSSNSTTSFQQETSHSEQQSSLNNGADDVAAPVLEEQFTEESPVDDPEQKIDHNTPVVRPVPGSIVFHPAARPPHLHRFRREVRDDEVDDEPSDKETSPESILIQSESDIEEYFGFIRQKDSDQCVARLICEISQNPHSFGDAGKQIQEFFREYNANPSMNATNFYKEASVLGHQDNTNCQSEFPRCDLTTEDMTTITQMSLDE